jgi:3-oxoacyl-[acyl-carrier protein] reductase
MRLSRKIALITGGGSGIGKASAILFAKHGAKVCVVDINSEGARETASVINADGGEAIFVEADVTNSDHVKRMLNETVEKFDRIDILFNNAGISSPLIMIEEIDEALWDKTMAVNVKSIFLACKYAIPIMKKQGSGVIINTGSIIAVRPRARQGAYLASKAAVVNLTKGIALEAAPYKIRVNCINPVAAETPLLDQILRDSTKEETDYEKEKEKYVASVPIGRLATAEDVAFAALYLASDEASMLTGTCINIDGGRGV